MTNNETGRLINEIAHITQSINTILTTNIGSRVLRENFGALLKPIMDMPVSESRTLQIISATYIAIMQWEPRIKINKVNVSFTGDMQHPKSVIYIQGEYKGQLFTVEV